MNRLTAAALLLLTSLMASRAAAQVILPQCQSPAICQTFGVSALVINPGGYIQWPDGVVSSSPFSAGAIPFGPAGGDLSGSYPNPSVVRVQAGGVDLSTVTSALAGKLSTSGGALTGSLTLVSPSSLTVQGAGGVVSPGFSSDADRLYAFPRTSSSSGTVVVANADTGIAIIGATTAFNGSNAGIQYNTEVSNRAQIRVNAYGNHAGVSGMTCTKSRGALGVDSSVTTGDILCRTTVAAAAATAGSKPNVADASYEAATVNATTMGVNYNLRLMNNAGTLATKMFLTSEGAASFAQGVTASSLTVSGAVSAASSSVTASGFFGNGFGLSNTVIVASSQTSSALAINSLTFVTVSTLTVTGMRGSRPTRIHVIAQIVNASAAAREYTMQIQKDGVNVGTAYVITTQNTINGNATQNMTVSETSTAGTHVYTALIMSSSAGATQTTTNRELTVQEF